MTATLQQIEAWSGDDLVIPYQIVDAVGAPENLTNYTAFSFAVRDKPKGTLVFTPQKGWHTGIEIIGPAVNGQLEVTLNSADTATYVVGGEKVTLVAELEGNKAGKIYTLSTGPFILHQSVAGVGA